MTLNFKPLRHGLLSGLALLMFFPVTALAHNGEVLDFDHPDPEEYQLFGTGLVTFRDVNGDGFQDVLSLAERVGTATRDWVIVLSSGNDGAILRIEGTPEVPFANQEQVAPTNTNNFSYPAAQITVISDITQDGIPDFTVYEGEDHPKESEYHRLHVYDGSTFGVIATLNDSDNRPFFGFSVASIHDFSNDGVPDLLVGSLSEESAGGFGAAFIVDASTFAILATLTESGSHNFGHQVLTLPDITQDGTPEIAVSDPNFHPSGSATNGEVFIYDGDSLNRIGTLQDERHGEGGKEYFFGIDTSMGPDLNGDGIGEIYVSSKELGDWLNNPDDVSSGRIHAIDLTTGLVVRTYLPKGGNGPSAVEWGSEFAFIGDSNGNGSNDMAIDDGYGRVEILDSSSSETIGIIATLDQIGLPASGLMDVNGDSRSDVVFGRPQIADATDVANGVWLREGEVRAFLSPFNGATSSATPETLDFGEFIIGVSEPKTLSVEIENTGVQDLFLTGALSRDVSLIPDDPFKVAPLADYQALLKTGETSRIEVTYNPTSPTDRDDELWIFTNDKAQPRRVVSLKGTAIEPPPPADPNAPLIVDNPEPYYVTQFGSDVEAFRDVDGDGVTDILTVGLEGKQWSIYVMDASGETVHQKVASPEFDYS
ncbi:MAG: hypothetical protein KC917_08085, partial [Candidatus Omnitrophica bacterium]|nr:hypothetical protein [Candidatus Omnitrophota bacterium]